MEFAVVVATKYLTFFQSLFVIEKQGHFGYVSRTLFRAYSLVSIVATGQDDVLGSGDLSKEQGELKEKCETLEQQNYAAGNELAELWVKVEISNSLLENVDLYGSSSTLAAQITRLKASLVEGDKIQKKAS